jgi:hypothetical protein
MPESHKCSYTTRAGAPCRSWAIPGTDPPACSAHAGRNVGAGAPPGNQNRRTHGFYAVALTRQELADLVAYAGDTTLDGEIACARVALRRVLNLLLSAGPEGSTLSPQEYGRLVALSLQATRTVARLLCIKRDLGDFAGDGPAALISSVLDELSAEWGVEL